MRRTLFVLVVMIALLVSPVHGKGKNKKGFFKECNVRCAKALMSSSCGNGVAAKIKDWTQCVAAVGGGLDQKYLQAVMQQISANGIEASKETC